MLNKKILLVTSEFEPFTDVGHLGRVTSSVSAALKETGVDIRVALPMYKSIPRDLRRAARLLCEFRQTLGSQQYSIRVFRTGFRDVPVYLISANDCFEGDHIYTSTENDVKRFVTFCASVLAMLENIDFAPNIIQCHDWQTSFIPILVNSNEGIYHLKHTPKILFIIHNMKYQGICPRYTLFEQLDMPGELFSHSALEFYGEANSLKGGIVFSDKLVTMSETYAKEIHHSFYGDNLEGVIRSRSSDLIGIHCGIDYDRYDPLTDSTIWANYEYSTYREGKAKNRSYLLKTLKLPKNNHRMLICFSAEVFDENKGIDLIQFVFNDIIEMNVGLIVSYKKRTDLGDYFAGKAAEFPDKVAYIKYGEELSETEVISGCDVLLRPSRIEPCGEKHQIALRYGTLPIVRETGGLMDVVVSYNEDTGEGNGFTFANYNAHDMLYTINRAYEVFRDKPNVWDALVKSAMSLDVSCCRTAERYLEVYREMTSD
ncbi:MAG: glycogen/starch synthase [Oscillospiraceae bacterium]|nr:glycogen/starch synthase [Oscillospiraceae bacterium]